MFGLATRQGLKRQLAGLRGCNTAPTRHAISRPHVQSIRNVSYQRFGQSAGSKGGPRGNIADRVKNAPPIVYVVAGGGGVYYVYHLEKTETGRYRFMDTAVVSEREMGEAATKEILQQYAGKILPESHSNARLVQRVADRIIRANGLGSGATASNPGHAAQQDNSAPDVQWKVRVIDEPQTKNAFVLPNGAIFVFTGMLPVCANEDGLAAVLGHEMAHQVARHGAERMSGQKVYLALQYLASMVFGIDPGLSQSAIGVLMQLPNSRSAETEADQIGLRLASRACFDPAEAMHMWERMQSSEGGSGPGMDFLSTHPANDRRIKAIKGWLPDANQIRADNCEGMAEYSKDFHRAIKA